MRFNQTLCKDHLEQKVDQLTDIILKQLEVNEQQKALNDSHQRSIEKLENILTSILAKGETVHV